MTTRTLVYSAWLVALAVGNAMGDAITISPAGIDSAGLTLFNGGPLTGDGIAIGQVELARPGKRVAAGGFDNGANSNPTVNPVDVFVRTVGGAPIANDNVNAHAEGVAGVMISTDTTDHDDIGPMVAPTGVAIAADLYAASFDPIGPDFDAEAAITAQHIATRNLGDVRAINMSFVNPQTGIHDNDGNQLLTQFIDWSARQHDVLYVVAMKNAAAPATRSIPIDNFNGMTIGSSDQVGGVYRQVSTLNDFTLNAEVEGNRTAISLLAPGVLVDLPALGGGAVTDSGSSFAAPHVTGTVALLQQYADERIMAGADGWNPNQNARRHEVMKAVLMNSADKLIDDGTIVPPGKTTAVPTGGLLGMSRTVIDRAGQNWLQSEAYGDFPFSEESFLPLDDEMGAGHLNARRARQQLHRVSLKRM